MVASAAVALLAFAATGASALTIRQQSPAPRTFPSLSGCPKATEYSCENSTKVENTCCSPTPGGLVLVTQFWNTYTNMESVGQFLPANHWGMHGLWPDNCDGSYEQYCDLSRQIDPEPSPNTTTGTPDGTPVSAWTGESATSILERFGRFDLLNYMKGYWVARDQPSDVLWAHEYAKHATCFSTFDTACYGSSYKPFEDAVDFWASAIRAHKMFPTWDILASAGILPSNTTTYTLSDLERAFETQIGAKPYFGCSGPDKTNRTTLSEVWVYAHVLGTPQFGQYKAIDSTTPSSCSNATGAIHYYERTPTSEVSKYKS